MSPWGHHQMYHFQLREECISLVHRQYLFFVCPWHHGTALIHFGLFCLQSRCKFCQASSMDTYLLVDYVLSDKRKAVFQDLSPGLWCQRVLLVTAPRLRVNEVRRNLCSLFQKLDMAEDCKKHEKDICAVRI